MFGAKAIAPLDAEWQAAVDATLREHGWPTTGDVRRLGPLVARLSEAYNTNAAAGDEGEALAARLGFSFARDVPKSALAVGELLTAGYLTIPAHGALRVLDVGAGLGASTWGIVRALEAAGAHGRVEASWTDADARALDVGRALARRILRGPIDLAISTRVSHAFERARGTFDLIVLGQVLSELDTDHDDDARATRHFDLVTALVRDALEPHGSLVIIEPALRQRTRHLHRVRDLVVAARAATVFAPCLHADPCPMLARPGDWCHEDAPLDLPPWLAALARAAGLRWQGLTFSYLVLRKDGRTLAEHAPPLRAVSELLRTKGKKEAMLCGRPASEAPARIVRMTRLDRDDTEDNRAFSQISRGDLVDVHPLDASVARIGKSTRVAIVSR